MHDDQKPSTGQGWQSDKAPVAEPAQLDLRRAAERREAVRPPSKPFSAKPFFKDNLFTGQHAKGKAMSDKVSSDRSPFTPHIALHKPHILSPAISRASKVHSAGKQLVIGQAISLTGEISGCERLVVKGHVDATLKDAKFIEVVQKGSFKGNADVENAFIGGTFDGSLKIRGHLEISSSGLVKGTVSYKTIAVANGGQVLGTIEPAGS